VNSRFYVRGYETLVALSIAIVLFAACRQREDGNDAGQPEQKATTPPSSIIFDTPGMPSVRGGALQTNSRLPPDVVDGIVRTNFGRFRLCYEAGAGLRVNPNLGGNIIVKFAIDRSGTVSAAQDGGSDLADQTVVSCVVRSFGNLSFPVPDGGIVTVVYPVIFSPR
jgi:hypothetical protein